MIHAVLIGAGARGMKSLGSYAVKRPHELKFIAVAEPDRKKREMFAEQHNIPSENQFNSWEELLDKPKLCETVFICTSDDLHYEPTMKALKKGYHVLLEKPMSTNPEETLEMAEYAKEVGKLLLIGHVLRYTPFYNTLKQIIDDGQIGQIMNIQWAENVSYWHHAHSYIRGNWGNSDKSSPMILAKSCHDTDLINWLIGETCEKVSSFGDLTYFKRENAPKGATLRCTDGCPVEDSCPFSALKLYYNERETWPQYMVSMEPTLEARWKALEESNYGKCVWHSDNNVVDHQVVNMQYSNEVTVSFTMAAFSDVGTRTFNIKGTKGEIFGDATANTLTIKYFSGKSESINPETVASGHGGGDHGLVKEFIKLVKENKIDGETSALKSAESHMIAFAAEESRLSGKTILMNDYIEEVRRNKVRN